MNNNFRAVVVVFLISLLVLIYLIINPVLIYPEKGSEINYHQSYNVGDTVEVFKGNDFDSGVWVAYIVINGSDNMDIAKDFPDGKLFKTRSIDLLKEMKKNLIFTYTGADVATVENRLIICNNNDVIFESGIILDEAQQGLQNKQFGFIQSDPPKKLLDFCKEFERVYLPIVILN